METEHKYGKQFIAIMESTGEVIGIGKSFWDCVSKSVVPADPNEMVVFKENTGRRMDIVDLMAINRIQFREDCKRMAMAHEAKYGKRG